MARDIEKQKQRKKEWYEANKAVTKQRALTFRQKRQVAITELKEKKGCTFCDECYGPCLEYHHTDPSNKVDSVSRLMRNASWEAVMEEVNKCLLVCANCHRKVHDGIIKVQ